MFFALAPYSWGKGKTVASARAQARRNIPDYVREHYRKLGARVPLKVYETSDMEAYVNFEGSLCTSRDAVTTEVI